MKKELLALTLAGLVNHAAADNSAEGTTQTPDAPKPPTQQHEDSAIVSTRGRKVDLAPHLQGTRERRRAAEAGAVIEIEIP